jgi:hypothetical protein
MKENNKLMKFVDLAVELEDRMAVIVSDDHTVPFHSIRQAP